MCSVAQPPPPSPPSFPDCIVYATYQYDVSDDSTRRVTSLAVHATDTLATLIHMLAARLHLSAARIVFTSPNGVVCTSIAPRPTTPLHMLNFTRGSGEPTYIVVTLLEHALPTLVAAT